MAQVPRLATNLSSYTQSQLRNLWTAAGGPRSQADIASAVAMAESSGRLSAIDYDKNGSIDYGPWQINSVHGYNSSELLNNALYNAKAAVAVYKNSGWGAWTTYTSGAYLNYLGADAPQGLLGLRQGITRPGGLGASSASTYPQPVSGIFASYGVDYTPTVSRTAPPAVMQDVSLGSDILAPFKWYLGIAADEWRVLRNGITQPIDALVSSGDAIAGAAGEAFKILRNINFYVLRLFEFTVGFIFVIFGTYLMFAQKNGSKTGKGLIRTAISTSPFAQDVRNKQAAIRGGQEGRTEHYRLAARRAARQSEAAKHPSSAPRKPVSKSRVMSQQKIGAERHKTMRDATNARNAASKATASK